MRPAEAAAWIRSRVLIPEEELTRTVKNGSQTIFENDVAFARMTLVPLGLVDASQRGLWSLTPKGRETHIDESNAEKLLQESRAHFKKRRDEQSDENVDFQDDGVAYWFVGTKWNERGDQLPRFREEGIWENGYRDQYLEHVRRMRPGDRVAAKATFTTKRVPFNVGGKLVSAMAIRATGTVLENLNDGRRVKVAWDPPKPQRLWYFYTYRVTIVEADKDSDDGRALIAFTFEGATQDHSLWLQRPYWIAKYGVREGTEGPGNNGISEPDGTEVEVDDPTYTIKDIVEDGCFMSEAELEGILARWRTKKNLILQGPPGTGKTWLAKRLGLALLGTRDNETSRSRLRVVQFHPSLAYEDFVRGLRPNNDGRLELVDGIFMESISAATMEPDRPFILVVEEINRGNPAQIFGEMLTLLEASKRTSAEAVELAYRRTPGERVHVPDNLYVIGTMNIADRSLAIVDLALRRRFAFVDLEPRFGEAWRSWCVGRGIPHAMTHEIERRVHALNETIATAPTLGSQFRIGHSYVTPDQPVTGDATAWFRQLVHTEIGPLLDEYWFDAPLTARAAREDLLRGL